MIGDESKKKKKIDSLVIKKLVLGSKSRHLYNMNEIIKVLTLGRVCLAL
jgi:hypothetical protein